VAGLHYSVRVERIDGLVARIERSEIRVDRPIRQNVPGFRHSAWKKRVNALMAQPGLRRPRTHHRSREAMAPPRFANSPRDNEGAERRQALGCSGTRRRTSNVGPQVLAKHLASRADHLRSPRAGDARLSALHRGDFLAPSPPWRNLRALHMSGALRSRIGEFTRPARSGGRAVLPGSLPGAWLRASPQDADPIPTLARLRRRPRRTGREHHVAVRRRVKNYLFAMNRTAALSPGTLLIATGCDDEFQFGLSFPSKPRYFTIRRVAGGAAASGAFGEINSVSHTFQPSGRACAANSL
jgi:hypothetical protein